MKQNHQASVINHYSLDTSENQTFCGVWKSCLNFLRNPESTSENSLSLRRDRQKDLIESFDLLVKIIESKQTHLANASWILNQNWNEYGNHLTSVNKKLLQVEASLARNLQQVKNIRQTI